MIDGLEELSDVLQKISDDQKQISDMHQRSSLFTASVLHASRPPVVVEVRSEFTPVEASKVITDFVQSSLLTPVEVSMDTRTVIDETNELMSETEVATSRKQNRAKAKKASKPPRAPTESMFLNVFEFRQTLNFWLKFKFSDLYVTIRIRIRNFGYPEIRISEISDSYSDSDMQFPKVSDIRISDIQNFGYPHMNSPTCT
ncbi:hypothetical protein LXL04_000346 [Taraxacum kok-saghyz]